MRTYFMIAVFAGLAMFAAAQSKDDRVISYRGPPWDGVWH